MPVPVIPLICLHENTDKKRAREPGGGVRKGGGRRERQMKGKGLQATHHPQELDLPWVFSASTGPWSRFPDCCLGSLVPLMFITSQSKESFWLVASLMEFLLGCITTSPLYPSENGMCQERIKAVYNQHLPFLLLEGGQGKGDAQCPSTRQEGMDCFPQPHSCMITMVNSWVITRANRSLQQSLLQQAEVAATPRAELEATKDCATHLPQHLPCCG